MDEPVHTEAEQVEQPDKEETENSSGQEQKTQKSKMQSGYYYWIDREKKYFEGVEPPNTKPQKVEGEEVSTPSLKSNSSGGSAWNSIGTWEERHIDRIELKDYLQDHISKAGDHTVKNLDLTSGSVSLVTVRGKRKIGYNLVVEFKLSKGDDKEWEVKCAEFTEYGDEEVSFSLTVVHRRSKGQDCTSFNRICLQATP